VEGAKIWDRALGFIESRMGKEVIETWFQPTRLGEINGSTATIIVPNKFFGEWLGRNYRVLMGEAIYSAQGIQGEGQVEIVFVVGEGGGMILQSTHQHLF